MNSASAMVDKKADLWFGDSSRLKLGGVIKGVVPEGVFILASRGKMSFFPWHAIMRIVIDP